MLKILAIDDNKDNLISLNAIISDALPETKFLSSQDGFKGLEAALLEDPDVIILDIVMPVLDGFEVCRRIKSNDILSDIPVIFLTSLKESKETLKKALESGADAFLSKPINEAELLAQIRTLAKVKEASVAKKKEKESLAKAVEERTRELNKSRNDALKLLEKLEKENEFRKEKEREIKFQSDLLNSISESVVATDSSGKITYWNIGAEKIFGWKREEVLGNDILDVIPTDMTRAQRAEIMEQLRRGESWKGEFRLKRKDGSEFFAEVFDHPIMDEINEQIGVLGVSYDITELINAEEKQKYYTERVKLLTKVTEELICRQTIEVAAHNMLKEIISAFQADAGIIRVISPEGLTLLTQVNIPDNEIVRVFPADFGITGQIIKNKEPQKFTNAIADEKTKNDTQYPKNDFRFRSYAGAPLLVKDNVIGIVGIYNVKEEKEFTDEDLAHLLIAANHIAVLIENGNLFNELLSRKTELENEINIRRETQEILSKSEEQLNMIVESTNAVFYKLDYKTMKYEYMHPAIYTLTGYTHAEICETGFHTLVVKVEQPGGEEIVTEQLVSNRPKLKYQFHADYQIRKKDGELCWLSDQSNPQLNERGELTGSVGMLIDITHRKEAEQEIKRAKDKAEELVRVKSSFFANMSHELRTPLVGILGFSELLKEELSGNEELRRISDFINISGKRLLETLNMILITSKLEEDKIEINLKQTNIILLLKDVASLYVPMAKQKGLSIEFNHGTDEILTYIDPNLIKSVFENLVNNGVKFTKKGGVTITAEVVRNEAVVKVIDTGIGIPLEKQGIIWEEFRQVSEGLSRSFEGTGLGLSISKKYTELMRGKISVESTPGAGTTFIVRLPVSSLKEFPFEETETEAEKEAARVKPGKKSSILFVEDDDAAIQIVLHSTRRIYDMDVAKSADEALKKVSGRVYDAILMDINLKMGLDGVQVTEILRKKPEYKDTPIIALTAYAADSDRENFLSHGMSYYISKPFRREKLLDIIEEALKK
ncbi:MAG: response regulator [Ignavibacteriaceae bacterium]